jgi:carboxyl-terminal processing protease
MNEEEIKSNGGFLKGVLTGVLFCALAALIILFAAKGSGSDSGSKTSIQSTSENEESTATLSSIADKLEMLQTVVDQYYYYEDDIDMDSIADNIYKAYIDGLEDKYSVYYTEDELNKMMENLNGSYCGIGAVVSQYDNGEVVIVMPYEGTPAEEAGLQPGDVILSIDGTELTGMQLDEAVSIVKGEEGSEATFVIRRDDEEFETTIERRQIDIPTVAGEIVQDDVAYISISSFDNTTTEQFESEIDELLAQGAKGIVFDLRDNGGGTLDSVVDMLDYLLPEELVLYMEDKYDNRESYYSEEGCIDETIPMAVIINGNTASASEVFTGALQDYERAKVFGTKSYGKGVVQNLIPLTDGSGIKLTIASYFTPLGRNFNHNGIDPDEVVELPEDDEAYDERGYLKDEYDTQKNAAVEYVKSMITE